ncbi:MAG: AfsR/SARP family transcriptional regulator [Pseudonocardiaceae bacterium]
MGVLGPVVLTVNGAALVPGAPKTRQLLAFLMLNANQVVRASECITELWGSQPPKSALSTLQTYVLHIRQILRNASRVGQSDTLVTRNQCYQLVVHPQDLDRLQFEDLARLGRAAAAEGDDQRAGELFTCALTLWRGPALADVHAGPLSSTHLVELEENRKGILEQRIEADLRLGRHRELLDELGTLTSSHPTHENLHAQFMLALYRSDERTRALAVFRRLRFVLAETLGIEPAPPMQRLYEAVLAGDPALDSPSSVRSRYPGRVAVDRSDQ